MPNNVSSFRQGCVEVVDIVGMLWECVAMPAHRLDTCPPHTRHTTFHATAKQAKQNRHAASPDPRCHTPFSVPPPQHPHNRQTSHTTATATAPTRPPIWDTLCLRTTSTVQSVCNLHCLGPHTVPMQEVQGRILWLTKMKYAVQNPNCARHKEPSTNRRMERP